VHDAKLFNRFYVLTWAIVFPINLAQNVLNSAVPLYVIGTLGLGEGFAGMLGIPYAVLAIVARFGFGYIADRKSRRLAMILGSLVFAVSTLCFGLLALLSVLLLLRGLQGAGFAGGYIAASTANVDVIPPVHMSRGISYFWVAMAVALGFSGYAVTLLSGKAEGGSADYTPIFVVMGLLLVISLVLSLFCNYEKKDIPRILALKGAGIRGFIEPRALRAGVIYFLYAMGHAGVGIYAMAFAKSRENLGYAEYANVGLFFLLCAVAMAAANFLTPVFERRLGSRMSLIVAFVIFVAGLLVMGLSYGLAPFLFGGAAFGLAQGFCSPLLYGLAMEGLPVERRGTGSSTFFVMLDLGIGAGTFLWGMIIDGVGYEVMFVCCAVVQSVAVVLTLVLFGGVNSNSIPKRHFKSGSK